MHPQSLFSPTATSLCSVNNTWMGGGKRGEVDFLLLYKYCNVPPVEKHWGAS